MIPNGPWRYHPAGTARAPNTHRTIAAGTPVKRQRPRVRAVFAAIPARSLCLH